MERKQTFQRLKNSCVELIQVIANLPQGSTPKKEVVQSLRQLLKTLQEVSSKPNALDEKLAEFVFVPISHVLRNSRIVPVHALELCLECISILLRTGWKGHLSPELSIQLLILLTFLANPSSAENGIPATSEELQAAAFKCMAELLAEVSRSPHGRRLLTSPANIPSLAKAVLVMVDSLTEVPSSAVRLEALATIQALSSGVDDRDALASFLPRMVSSLTKLLTPSSSNRTGFRVLERGLDTFTLLLQRILSDNETKGLPSHIIQDDPKSSEKVVRTTSWLQATTSQIKIALASILKLRNHDKREIRYSLLQLCLRVIQDCRKSLSECTGMMIETLVTLAGHEQQDAIYSELKALLTSDVKLAELLRESLHGWVIALPRVMQSKDDTGRRQVVHQVTVTVQLLQGEEMDLTMVDNLLAENLRDSVSTILSDSKDTGAMIEMSSDTSLDQALVLSNTRLSQFPPLKLRQKGRNDMISEFRILLQQLAKSSSAVNVAQDLIDALDSESREKRLATFWLCVNLYREIHESNSVVDEFLDWGASDAQTELLDELYTFSLACILDSNSDSQLDWRMQALSLEVLALQSMRFKLDFREELVEALYPVLHLLGSSGAELRSHAMTCLNIVAHSCGYLSASDLVISNVDYIVNAVGLKLNYHDISPQAPQVLLMMMRLCGPSLLPYLEDLVGSMFSALERFHGYPKLVELLFSVLKGMAEEGVKEPQFMIAGVEENSKPFHASTTTSIGEVVDLVSTLKAHALKADDDPRNLVETPFARRPWNSIDGNHQEDESKQEPDQPEDGTTQSADAPPPAPKTFDMLLKISELTQHYLTSSSPSLRSSLLSLLQTTIPALAQHENSFLPLINTLWPILTPRLEDPEAYVVSNALDIVALMCTHAGNFMKGRIEGIWEDIKALYRRAENKSDVQARNKQLSATSLNLSSSKKVFIQSTHTDEIDLYRPELYVDAPTRMIRESLNNLLCTIARNVAIQEEYFDNIVDMLDKHLEKEDVRKALESRNSDAVWLRLWRKSANQLSGTAVVQEESNEEGIRWKKIPKGKPYWDFAQVRVP